MVHRFNTTNETNPMVRAFAEGLKAWERPCGCLDRVRVRGAVKTRGAVLGRRLRALPEGDEGLRPFREGVDRWERPLRTRKR